MDSNLGFVAKVLLVSILVSLAIKYGGPYLPIAGTTTTVLLAILLPASAVAATLGWRFWQQRQS